MHYAFLIYLSCLVLYLLLVLLGRGRRGFVGGDNIILHKRATYKHGASCWHRFVNNLGVLVIFVCSCHVPFKQRVDLCHQIVGFQNFYWQNSLHVSVGLLESFFISVSGFSLLQQHAFFRFFLSFHFSDNIMRPEISSSMNNHQASKGLFQLCVASYLGKAFLQSLIT